jgi:hypothetical protein
MALEVTMAHSLRPLCACLVLLFPSGIAAQEPARGADVEARIGRLAAEVSALQGAMRQRDEELAGLAKSLETLGGDVGVLKHAVAPPMAGPFLAAPPPSSDNVGIAKTAVLAPRIEVDASRRHDLVLLRVRRLEAEEARLVADTELGQDQTGVELPIDRSGALYVVDWSTTDGQAYTLQLKDGATELAAAVVQVKPFQASGRFVFVGYRLE